MPDVSGQVHEIRNEMRDKFFFKIGGGLTLKDLKITGD
jgi:hypothetical protein